MYKPGDICVGKGFTESHNIKYNGSTCTIIDPLGDYSGRSFNPPYNTVTLHGYGVRWADGDMQYVRPGYLSLKRNYTFLSSWAIIEAICGWRPKC
jgi:hypothetical protein